MRPVTIVLSVLALAAVGAALGLTIHGPAAAAAGPALAGAAGGLGIGLAGWDIRDRVRRRDAG